MSVVVRMEMPGCCWDCPCLDDYGDYPRCRISNEQRGYNFPIHEKRMPGCPITQPLPEGHGDLIDRGVLLQTFQNADYETYNDYCEAFDTTEAAETIVPAERSETK